MRSKTSLRGRPRVISDEDLLLAARAVFLDQSVGATTAQVARKARISESVIFHRYKNKEALFLAVLDHERRVPPLLEVLEQRVGSGELASTLFDVGMSVIEAGRAVMPFLLVASAMARASNWKLDLLRERMKKPRPELKRSVRLLASYLDAEATAGRLRKIGNSEALALVFFSAMMQQVMQQQWWPHEFSPLDAPDFVRAFVDLFLHGVAPQAPAPREPRGRNR